MAYCMKRSEMKKKLDMNIYQGSYKIPRYLQEFLEEQKKTTRLSINAQLNFMIEKEYNEKHGVKK